MSQAKYLFDRMLVMGTGLMGGSLALAVKNAALVNTVVGWGRREETLQTAVDSGVIDSYHLDLQQALDGVDCVVVATPTQLAEQLLVEVVERVDKRVVITDVASVKGNLVDALHSHFGCVPANVVLAHPITGSEKSGITAVKADLYHKQLVILLGDETVDATALTSVEALWQSVGATTRWMTAEQHDQVLALTSHLPHLLAYALVLQLNQDSTVDDVFAFAGGGFRDFTRIAGSDPRMWREIIGANRAQILKALENYELKLAQLKQMIVNENDDQLEAEFKQSKTVRDAFIENFNAQRKP